METMTINWTEIILGLMTLLSGCGWFVAGRKYRQEVKGLKADNRQKDMDLSKDYVTEWRTFIAEPTNEARAEAKLALTMPCKEEEDEVNPCSAR